ncbi:AAA family ATPase [Raoultella ornithinolytica]|uniref:AAA family ATPase n=1 Tax=Raoultella ornithinolytica TaxID=54291 RepID=UPI002272E28E|nr:AAA family ATPase [Raoultella ornithinolytica]EKU0200077.1 AAA family ATPase [Raoultella ornithinolytica]EKU0200684.1 AAA family ATPase [Raoultella ornithinolytica]EKV8288454.1 AAA family ATPase [Raoultella ornithinolytica]EKW3195049.1 AAA family ATPase [Raoultella ornithinolytica]
MIIKAEGKELHKGFILEEPAIFSGHIFALTGRNGSGKTRFIESVENRKTKLYLDGEEIQPHLIKTLPLNSLNPNLGTLYNDEAYNKKLSESIMAYDYIKNFIHDPASCTESVKFNSSLENINITSLRKLAFSIAKRINKPVSELTHEDITFHFEIDSSYFLNIQDISVIINRYIKRVNENAFNEWKSTVRGIPAQYYTEDKFTEIFGEKPWILLNKILAETFDGKFVINAPDESSLNYNYIAKIILTEDSSEVTTEYLSSGEKIILWLSLILFKSQYCKEENISTPQILLIDEPDTYLHPKMVLHMYKVFNSYSKVFNSAIFITTHSPTSVALCPDENIYLLENNSIIQTDKDSAIADLLDGVTQIALNPKNRRQVFVESQYDANVYESVYAKLVHRSEIIDPKISINFISAGPKVPKDQLTGKVKQILGVHDDTILDEFVRLVNGVGNCVQVKGQVNALTENENSTIRGIIDWDLENKPSEYIKVFAHEYAYSIENLTLDPICILLLLHIDKPELITIFDICGKNVGWEEWLIDKHLLQVAIDRFIHKVLKRESKKNAKLKYVSQLEFDTDQEYLTMNGHALEKLVISAYQQLNAYCKKKQEGELKSTIVKRSMINFAKGEFIPKAYEEIISEIQK